MEQMILKAVTTATEKGTFTAVVSAATIDREKDIVDPAGMVRALRKWTQTGKKIPLAWNHSGAPDQQIGWIDPASAKAIGGEVQVSGWIDQSIEAGQHAWRLVKMGTLGFSFGYLILKATKRQGGGRNISELDVFEITATATPMNNDTRVLSFKAAMAKMPAGVRDRMKQMAGAQDMADMDPVELLACMLMMAQEYIDNAPDAEDASEMQGILDDLKELVTDVDDAADQAEDQAEDGKALRRRAEQVEREDREGRFPKLGAAPPEPTPVPAPDPPAPPDASEQRRKAAQLEREQKQHDRRAEEQGLPDLGPAPAAPAPAPDPPIPPDTERQRRKAAQLEREQKQHDRRAEERALPDVGPPPAEPAPEPKAAAPDPPDAVGQRRKAAQLERDERRQAEERQLPDLGDAPPEYALLRISHEEMDGLADGELKAVWSAAFQNSLPDSAFLYVEPGGTKDSDGRTVPRALRHFPYKDDAGAIDMPHLRNALARVPQSDLSPAVKDELTAKAQRILDGQKSLKVDATDQEARGLRSVDPLRARAQAVELEFASGGESRRKPPAQKDAPKQTPELALSELRQRTRDETLIALSGVEQI